MVRGWSRHTCLSLSPHTVDTVWDMMIDPRRGHSWQRRSWPQLLNTETEIQGMSQPGQRQLQLPVQAHKRDPNKTSTPTVTACFYECVFALSHIQLFAACQAPLSLGFSRQEYWSGLPCPPPGDLPDPGIKPASLLSPALAGRFFTTRAT